MVFFQAELLAGYALAHVFGRALSPGRQRIAVGVLFGLAALVLPIEISHRAIGPPPAESSPVLWLLAALAVSVGLPFLVLSLLSPLIQQWFSTSERAGSRDPYFLYAASNLGSLLALFAYPALWEPRFTLAKQGLWWSYGYCVLGFLICGCAMWSYRGSRRHIAALEVGVRPILWSRRLRWLALAMVPSSLMLGVTTYLSTDIAAMPLLWVLPLGLYLVSFIVVFGPGWRKLSHPLPRLAPGAALVLIVLILFEDMQPPIGIVIAAHLGAFFLLALYCHGRLADDRPDPAHLTEFYLWLALGGVLGGIFNALVAPLIFPRVIEYPLAVLAACCVRPSVAGTTAQKRLDWLLPTGLAAFTVALVLGVGRLPLEPPQLRAGLMFGLPAILAYTMVDRPMRYSLALTAVFLSSALYPSAQGRALSTERSFFGVHRVTRDSTGRFHLLVHGNTVHGRENRTPGHESVPLAYYHASGPAGQFFHDMDAHLAHARIGAIGLGAGSMSAYARPDQDWTYYEIDPTVIRIASNPSYFTFLAHSHAKSLEIVPGDGRLQLAKAPKHTYDVLIMDAFSSDAVPVHLLTSESLKMYFSKLRPGGTLLFHISNRYLDLQPVLAGLAKALRLECRFYDDLELSETEREAGKDFSQWAVLAAPDSRVWKELANPRWRRYSLTGREPIWTDDYSSLLPLFKWQ
jgi:spermidine synthase